MDSKLKSVALNLLATNQSLYAPLKILSYQAISKAPSRSRYTPDAQLTLEWKRQKFKFSVEVTGNLYLEAKLAKLKQSIANRSDVMILVSYLTKGISELVQREEVSCVDLSGNFFIQREGLIAIRIDKPDQYKSFSRIRKVYSGNSSLVGRFLLAGGKIDPPGLLSLQRELQSRYGELAQSTISKVLSEMELDQIILKEPSGLKLLQPRKLLEKLTEQYKSPSLIQTIRAKCPKDPGLWLTENFGTDWIRTGEASANRYSATAPNPVLSAYVQYLPNEMPEIDDRFYNLIINVTNDSFVYFDCEPNDPKRWASQIQTYLELMTMDKREREIAETIKENILSRYE